MEISGLFIYPIKACAGRSLTEATLTPRGLANDRWMMVVDDDGRFLTQRECPTLALVQPALTDDVLTLSTAGGDGLTTPIRRDGPRRDVVVWRSTCAAIDQGDAAAAWFSAHLGRPARPTRPGSPTASRCW